MRPGGIQLLNRLIFPDLPRLVDALRFDHSDNP